MNTTWTEIASKLAEIPIYKGTLSVWVHSIDACDHYLPEGFRNAAKALAHLVVAGDIAEADAHLGLAWVCQGDEWAAKEVAGRFLSGVRRIRLVAAIRRHPRAARFCSLVDAIERGRFTKAQLALATKLATEAA